MNDWELIDKEVEDAFTNGGILQSDRSTLERWMVALVGRTYEYERDQQPLLQRLEAIKHLLAVRLTEESEKRRDEQAAKSAAEMQHHNFWTRWISVGALIVAALGVWMTWLTHATRETQAPVSPTTQSQSSQAGTPPKK